MRHLGTRGLCAFLLFVGSIAVPTAIATQITAVSHNALPAGETLTLTGSGFSDPTAVSLFFGPFSSQATEVDSPSDDTLNLTFPQLDRGTRQYSILVETTHGSTVSPAEEYGPPTEFSGIGPITGGSLSLIIRPGAVATAFPAFPIQFVFVESGAVIQGFSSQSDAHIFAADGATLDFRSNDFSSGPTPPSVYYSPGTTVLGDLPAPGAYNVVRQVTPLTLSSGIGGFSEGCRLNLAVEGPGSVTLEPDQEFYSSNTLVQATAVPDAGAFFVRWGGALSSRTLVETIRVRTPCDLTARFSDRPDFFSDWRSRFFSPEELADPAVSGLNADPDNDSYTNAAEYAFGTDPSIAQAGQGLRVRQAPAADDASIMIVYSRPVDAADIDYRLLASTGLGSWTDGSDPDLLFTSVERKVVSSGNRVERVTLAVTFTDGIPNAVYFQLNADIEDLP